MCLPCGTEFVSEFVQQRVFATQGDAPQRRLCNDGGNKQAETSTRTGHARWFNIGRGYGFITSDAGDGVVFVHHSDIQGRNPRPCSKGAR